MKPPRISGIRRPSPARIRFLLGTGALVAGVLVYLLARPAGSAYFVEKFLGPGWDRHLPGPVLLPFAGNFPAFAHVLGFSLIFAAVLGGKKKAGAAVCIFWTLVNLAFEAGQYYGPAVAGHIPPAFDSWPFLENARAFFLTGFFDPLDMAAAGLGGLVAYILIRMTQPDAKTGVRHEKHGRSA